MKIKNKVSAKLLGTAVLSTVLFFSNCKKEEELIPQDKTLNSSEVNLNDSLDRFELTAAEVDDSYYNIINALPKGYVKNGSVDYTSYIQSAINKYSKVAFPGFPIMVNDNGLSIPSNRKIVFIDGSQLRLKPSSKPSYSIIRIENATNVTLVNPYIVGDRYEHKGTTGEWGNGIAVHSSKKVNISKATVINCWGDGIYIGTRNHVPCEDIRLFKPYCKSNRRDGISIISVKGLEIISPYTGYTDGTSPFCGINFEPDNAKDELTGIVITNPVTEKNLGNGIQIGLSKMYSSHAKKIDIKISSHSDMGSFYAYKVSNVKPDGSGYLYGDIISSKPTWKYNESRPFWMAQTDAKLNIRIESPTIIGLPGSTVSKLTTTDSQLKFGLKSFSLPYSLSL